MQRPNFPLRRSNSILLYGLGLALVLSLVFNGFLLYEQSHLRSTYEYELSNLGHPIDFLAWQQQLSDCQRANQEKDVLIGRLQQASKAPPGQVVTLDHDALK